MWFYAVIAHLLGQMCGTFRDVLLCTMVVMIGYLCYLLSSYQLEVVFSSDL